VGGAARAARPCPVRRPAARDTAGARWGGTLVWRNDSRSLVATTRKV